MENKEKLEKELLSKPETAKTVLAMKALEVEKKKAEDQKAFFDKIDAVLKEVLNVASKPAGLALASVNELSSIGFTLKELKAQAADKDLENQNTTKLLEAIDVLNKSLQAALAKEVPAPVVKITPAPITVPAPTVIDKTHIVQETKQAELMVGLLEKILSRSGKTAVEGAVRITNARPDDAIPVVLVDAGLKKFYNAVSELVAAVSSQGAVQLINSQGQKVGVTNNALDVNMTNSISVTVDPTGLATDTGQATGNAYLETIAGAIVDGKMQVEAEIKVEDIEIGAVELKDATTDTRVKIKSDGVDNALVVTQNSQPLPDGAATSTLQETANTILDSLDTKLGDVATNPGANTVLGRLKDLLTGIVLSAGSAVIGAVTQSGNWIMRLADGSGNAINSTGGALDVSLPAAQISTLTPPPAITNFANETGGNLAAIKAKTDNITKADTDHVTVSAPLPAGTNLLGKVGIDQTSPGTTNKVSLGSDPIVDGGSGKTLKSAKFSLSSTGTIVSAVPLKRIKVYAIKLNCSAAISVKLRDGASTDLEDLQAYAANGGYTEAINPPGFLVGTTAGNSLDLVISGTGTAAGRVSYFDDDSV